MVGLHIPVTFHLLYTNKFLEAKYKQKCRDLRKRIREIEEHNDLVGLSISRTKRDIKRLRLERSLLMEKIEERTLLKVEDSDGSPSPPSSPTLPVIDGAGGTGRKGANSSSHRSKSPGFDEQTSSPTPSRGGSSHRKSRHTNGGKDHSESPDEDDDDAAGPPSTPSGHSRRKPARRDPNLPKRPQNSYIIFCELEKERVKREVEEANPGQPFDLTKAMAEKWRVLTDTERQRFFQIYEDDKERYAREMVAYDLPNPSPSEQREKQRAEKTLRDIEKQREENRRNAAAEEVSAETKASADAADTTETAEAEAEAEVEAEAEAEAEAEVEAEAEPETNDESLHASEPQGTKEEAMNEEPEGPKTLEEDSVTGIKQEAATEETSADTEMKDA